jgi:hypothetical protein
MAAYRGSKSKSSGTGAGYRSPSYGEFKDRNLAGMSPEKAQNSLQPTPAEPVNMHKRMAGCK